MIIYFPLFSVILSLIVETTQGPVAKIPHQGNYLGISKDKGFSFYGIPYAQPPMNDLRFKMPFELPLSDNQDLKNATVPGFACIPKPGLKRDIPVSEDCLNLNVFVPKPKGTPLPVLFYIYGSGFAYGNDMQAQNPGIGFLPKFFLYDGQRIISQHDDIIIVIFHYRLGVLGFTSSKEFASQGILNLGLHDCLAALQWVKKNIGNFGGDPEAITVGGHSSGGILASSMLLMNNGTQKLFKGAMILSGPAPYEFSDSKERGFETSFSAVKERVGCSDLKDLDSTMGCLRSVDAELLVNSSTDIQYALSASAGFLPYDVMDAFEQGRFSKVPVYVSTAEDESRTLGKSFSRFLGRPNTTLTTENVKENLDYITARKYSDSELERILDFYMKRYDNNATLAVDAYLGDNFKCPSTMLAQTWAKFNIPVFTMQWKSVPSLIKLLRNQIKRAFHGADVFYTWQSALLLGPDFELAKQNTNAYVGFIKGLKTPLQQWNDYRDQKKRFVFETMAMEYDTEIDSEYCLFLKTLSIEHKRNHLTTKP